MTALVIIDSDDGPPCPSRIKGGYARGLWQAIVPLITRNPEYTNMDLVLLGEYCRIAGAMEDLWEKSVGKEVHIGTKGQLLVNPATKVYLAFLNELKLLSKQLGLTMQTQLTLERNRLVIKVLEQRTKEEKNMLSDWQTDNADNDDSD